jgi:ribosome-binding ATPase YchF (GTP1/OBG family)
MADLAAGRTEQAAIQDQDSLHGAAGYLHAASIFNHAGQSLKVSADGCGLQGKAYVVVDGDIILFKFNVTSSGKK